MKRNWFLLAGMLLVLTSFAQAQLQQIQPPCRLWDCPDPRGPWEFSGGVSAALPANGLAASRALEFNPAYRVLSDSRAALFVESPLVIGSAAKVTYADGVQSYRSYFFTPSLRVQFNVWRWFRPWFSGGGGPSMGVPASGVASLQQRNPGTMITAAGQFGGGADITPFNSRVGFRLELRDFISNVPNVEAGERKMQNTLIPAGSVTLRF